MADPRRSKPRNKPKPKGKKAVTWSAAERDLLRKAGKDGFMSDVRTVAEKNALLEIARGTLFEKEAGRFGLTADDDVDVITKRSAWNKWQNKPVERREGFLDVIKEPLTPGFNVRDLQNQMVKGGFLKRGDYRPGQYDAATISAYTDVVRAAAREAKTPREILSAYSESMEEIPEPEDTFVAPAIEKIDEASLDGQVQKAFVAAYGRTGTPQERERFKAAYRQMELEKHRVRVRNERMTF